MSTCLIVLSRSDNVFSNARRSGSGALSADCGGCLRFLIYFFFVLMTFPFTISDFLSVYYIGLMRLGA